MCKAYVTCVTRLQELPASDTAIPLHERRAPCTEYTANVFAWLSFSWLTPLMRRGYKAPLELHDVWELPPPDTVDAVGSAFQKHWAEQMRSGANCVVAVRLYVMPLACILGTCCRR
jgi:hypothetical protein